MFRKNFIFIISIFVVFLVACLPIFPLIVEMREIAQDGESLLQEWRLVSIPEFYDAAHYAQLGWLDSTWNNYLILFALNHVWLIVVFFVVRKILSQLFLEVKQKR